MYASTSSGEYTPSAYLPDFAVALPCWLALYGDMGWNMILQIIFADIVVKYLIAALPAVRGRGHEDRLIRIPVK